MGEKKHRRMYEQRENENLTTQTRMGVTDCDGCLSTRAACFWRGENIGGVMEEKKYFHVTGYYQGDSCVFTPRLPGYIQKGEDRNTPRICVTDNWKHSLRSIIVLHRLRVAYVYCSCAPPLSPLEHRAYLISEKKLRRTSNNFNLPRDGIINNEKWYITPIEMKLEGMVKVPKEDYARMLMSFGFSFGDPKIEKYKIEPYEKEDYFSSI